MNRRATFIAILLCVTFGSGQPSTFAAAHCETTEVLTGRAYWFLRGYFGIEGEQEINGLISGRRSDEPGICIEVAAKLTRDQDAAFKGLSEAMYNWFGWLPVSEEPAELADPDVQMALAGLTKLTGQSFETRAEWGQWLEANRDYLTFSETENRLVVDVTAKQAGRPLQKPDLPVYNATADRYWYYEGLGWIEETLDDNQLFRVWSGDREVILKVIGPIEISTAKEIGYKSAAKLLITDRLAMEYLGDEDLEVIIGRLRVITDQEFDSPEAWRIWWNNSESRLVLSPDGQRLVANGRGR